MICTSIKTQHTKEQNNQRPISFSTSLYSRMALAGIFSALSPKLYIARSGSIVTLVSSSILALREKIRETTTVKRIKILEEKKVLQKDKAAELIEAFDVVNNLRLKAQLEHIQDGKKINNEVDTHTLGKIERDLLKDSFKIVNEFKKFINYTFRIDKIS